MQNDNLTAIHAVENCMGGGYEFSTLPYNKKKVEGKEQDFSVVECCIANATCKMDVICDKYNITSEELISGLWGMVLQLYNYDNQARFIYSCEDNRFEVIEIDNRTMFCDVFKDICKNRVSIMEDNLRVYGKKTIVSCGKSSGSKLTDAKLFGTNGQTLYVDYEVSGEDLKINIGCVKEYYNAFCINNIEALHGNLIDRLYSGEESFLFQDLMTKSDYSLLSSINDNEYSYKLEYPVSKLIEIQAQKKPNNIALYYDELQYSYKEVNGKANALARTLIKKGITKGDFVPVYMTRSPELVISLLAINKAGAAFVPIDLNWSEDKVSKTVSKCRGKVVITNIDEYCQNNPIALNVNVSNLSIEDNLDVSVDLDDNIYAIFTSGTTGEPKGAINKHLGIVNRFLYMNNRYKITEGDTILLTSNHAFDSSVWQMFWPLINGNATVLPHQSKRMNLLEVINTVEKFKITITDFVPSVFNAMVDIIEIKKAYQSKLSTLRQLLIGGEEMSPSHIYRFKKMFPNVSITNTYGPAEASIGTVFYELPNEEIDCIPIGRSIGNVETYVLNTNKKLMPPGAMGILYLGGVCVGKGYVNDDERTEKFFGNVDVWGDRENKYLYNTGDLVQLNGDLNLDFYGRLDKQVKINGVRVELSEIEFEMNNIRGVQTSCATYNKENDTGILRLYYVSNEENVSEEIVKGVLVEKLPPYIITAQVRRIESIPVTSNGKVDYKQLSLLAN